MCRTVALIASLLAFAPALAVGQQSRPDKVAFQPANDIDQNLFLMCYLEHILRTWRAPAPSDHHYHVWVTGTRTQLVQLQKVAELDGLNKDVVVCVRDVIELLNEYDTFARTTELSEFISTVHKIQIDAWAPTPSDGAISGATNGAQVGAAVGSLGGPVGGLVGAAGGGVLGGTVGYFSFDKYEASLKSKAGIDEARRKFLLSDSRRLRSRIESAYQGLRITAKRLGSAERYNWGDEAGFENEAALNLPDQASRRPRNPFLKVLAAQAATKESRANRVSACWEAARLVPVDGAEDVDVYDNLRSAMLITGARIACEGMDTSTITFTPPDHAVTDNKVRSKLIGVAVLLTMEIAKSKLNATERGNTTDDCMLTEAIDLFRAAEQCCKSMPPADRERFADILLVSKEWKDAAIQYQACLPAKKSKQLTFKYACALSGANDTAGAWKHFCFAYGMRPSWRPELLENPHLQNLAKAKPEELALLVKPPVVGSWQRSGEDIVFGHGGGFTRKAGSTTDSGLYHFVGSDQVRVEVRGAWGTKEELYRYQVKDGRLTLTPFIKRLIGSTPGTPVIYNHAQRK